MTLTVTDRRRLWVIDALGSERTLQEIYSHVRVKGVVTSMETVREDLIDLTTKGLAQRLRNGKWVLA